MKNVIFAPEEMVQDSFQAFLVEGAYFTSKEEYPIIPSNMVSKVIPKKIMPFNKAIIYRGDLRDYYICTFAPDDSFERVRRNPRKFINFFKRTGGIIGFDFSIHSDMPIIKQKRQMDDNLSLTYFFGKNGIPVIPNLRCGVDELEDEFLQAIPKKTIVAIGTHGFIKTKQEQCEWYCFIEKIINVLMPTTIICYGSLRNSMFDNLKSKTNFIFFEPWIYNKGKEVNKNVD